MREAIATELDRLEKNKIVSKVDHSEWATPTVNIPKKDTTVRICADYKVTLNQLIDMNRYPLPTAEDIFATLAGGKQFTTLDLSHAYTQLEVEDTSKEYLTLNTHKGLYRLNNLSYGVSSAPAIFQRTMDQILSGLDGVACYLDDIILTAPSKREHLTLLENVLAKLERQGIRLKQSKCAYIQDEVEYLGYVVDSRGIRPTQAKTRALLEAPRPGVVTELASHLGLLRYYSRFLPDISTILQPLDELRHKKGMWLWNDKCDKAFQESKQMILGARVLCHYNMSSLRATPRRMV